MKGPGGAEAEEEKACDEWDQAFGSSFEKSNCSGDGRDEGHNCGGRGEEPGGAAGEPAN